MSDTKLKTCPFCGNKVSASVMQIGHKKGCFLKAVLDKEPFKTGEQWDEAWNTRTSLKDELIETARKVCWYDWSDNDEDAVCAVDQLREAIEELDK